MATTRPSYVCANCARALRSTTRSANFSRAFGTSAKLSAPNGSGLAALEDQSQSPRWARTPPRMRMPLRLRPVPNQPAWSVNDKQEALDEVMDRFLKRALGSDTKGRDILPEEVKWLSVTHKSFEHGARGFNDRLALLGRRILDVQTSVALLTAPSVASINAQAGQGSGSILSNGTGLEVDNITPEAKDSFLAPTRLSRLAASYGINKIVRWKPRNTADLAWSGVDAVMAQTIYAIIGAVALQKGGEVAATVARKSVLAPLGLR